MRTLTEIKNDLAEIDHKRNRLLKELNEFRWNALGVKIGDIIIATSHRLQGTRFKLASLRFDDYTDGFIAGHLTSWRPWATGYRELKDGSWGKVPMQLFSDWKKS